MLFRSTPPRREIFRAVMRVFHTFLAPVWAKKLGKTRMTARQISRRGGVVAVRLEGGRVFLGGKVVLFMEGEIPFDL